MVAAGRKDLSLNPDAQATLGALREALESPREPNTALAVDPAAVRLVVKMATEWDYGDRLAPCDLLRCIAPSPAFADVALLSGGAGPVQVAVSAALDGVTAGAAPNENLAMMALRAVANLFGSGAGREQLLAQPAESAGAVALVERVLGVSGAPAIGPFNRNLLVALTTVAINLAVLATHDPGRLPRDRLPRLLDALSVVLQVQSDGEVVFRALVATGTAVAALALPEAQGGDRPPAGQQQPPLAAALRPLVAACADRVADPRVKDAAREVLGLLR